MKQIIASDIMNNLENKTEEKSFMQKQMRLTWAGYWRITMIILLIEYGLFLLFGRWVPIERQYVFLSLTFAIFLALFLFIKNILDFFELESKGKKIYLCIFVVLAFYGIYRAWIFLPNNPDTALSTFQYAYSLLLVLSCGYIVLETLLRKTSSKLTKMFSVVFFLFSIWVGSAVQLKSLIGLPPLDCFQVQNIVSSEFKICVGALPPPPPPVSAPCMDCNTVTPQMKAEADAFWGQIAETNTKYSWAQVVPDCCFIRIMVEGRGDIRVPTESSKESIGAILNGIITSTSTSVLEVGGKIPWSEVLRLINTCQVQSFSDYNTIWNLYLKNGNPNYSAKATYSMVEEANKAASSTCNGMFPMSHY